MPALPTFLTHEALLRMIHWLVFSETDREAVYLPFWVQKCTYSVRVPARLPLRVGSIIVLTEARRHGDTQ